MHPMRPARDILASNTMRPMRAPADSVRRLAGRTLRVLRDTSGDGERVRRKRGRETAAGGVSFIDSDLAHVSDPEWRDWYLANGVRRKGNAYFCPFHEDRKSPSFGISGRGWTCFKENLHGDAVGFLVKRDGLSRDEAILELREEFNINTEKRAAAKANRVVAEHSYPDSEGKPWLRKVRYEPKSFIWQHAEGDGWKTCKECGHEQPLYRLAEILAADESQPLFVSEGEKAADRLAALGLVATSSGGAQSWKEHHGGQFPPGRDVAVLRDNDTAGAQYAETVAAALATKARSLRVVLLPNLPEGGDPWDFCQRGGTAAGVLEAVANTPAWKPQIDLDGAALLERIETFIRRFCVLSPAQAFVLALWVLHTWCAEASETTPYIAVTSPEKETGKTRVLEVLDYLVNGSYFVVTPSESSMFRRIARPPTTVLLDEIDAVFGKRAQDTQELRGIFNAGYRRGAAIPRINMDKPGADKIEMFDPFCPKGFAGIGELPETLASRSYQIRMKRRTNEEKIERFRQKAVRAETKPLRDEIAKWIAPRVERLAAARPAEIGGITDRMEDASEPLLAIAEMTGFGVRARTAILEICSSGAAADQSIGARLLADIRLVMGDRLTITSVDLCTQLRKIEASPWSMWRHGEGFKPYDLAKGLKPYDITSKQVRDDYGNNVHGYRIEDFAETFKRYPLTRAAEEEVA